MRLLVEEDDAGFLSSVGSVNENPPNTLSSQRSSSMPEITKLFCLKLMTQSSSSKERSTVAFLIAVLGVVVEGEGEPGSARKTERADWVLLVSTFTVDRGVVVTVGRSFGKRENEKYNNGDNEE